jgi:hypothetical protein
MGATPAPKMTVLNVGHFAGSGVGHAPKRPTVFCVRRVPKFHTVGESSQYERIRRQLQGSAGIRGGSSAYDKAASFRLAVFLRV